MLERSNAGKLLVIAGLVVLLLAATTVTALAQTKTQPTAATPSKTDSPAASSAQVAVDPVTHQLRQPTAEEARALASQMKATRSAKSLKAVKHSNGSKSVALSDQFMETMVARVNADGTVSQACVETPAEAEAFVKEDVKKPATTKSAPATAPAEEVQ